mgnify:CR=1 FL=1|tara:strand:- start:85 stop:549 length:465 start_codon:yes stop_codon:yes gene_type:complete
MKHLATEQDGIELLYRGDNLTDTPFSDISDYNKFCEELELLPLSNESYFSKDFNIPKHYKELDVEKFIKSKIPASGQDVKITTARVDMELEMYKDRGLFPILQLLIYVVDVMRKNNLVWGVGRGSSVASYVLYILGIHKIDSHKYKLDIKEFLK